MVLEAIYEQDFLPCSYGFRRRRSAHMALRELHGAITWRRQNWVLDVDIREYFASIPHAQLRAFLDQRVTDGVIRRMTDKWRKAGGLEEGLLRLAAVRLSWVHPHLGEVTEGHERGTAEDGQKPTCSRAARSKGMVSDQPPPPNARAAQAAV